jgi:hypothetical protein
MIETRGTIDEEEVARFSRMSSQWWDARGPMAALHKFNPVRLAYIRDRVAEHFDRDAKRLDSLKGLRILDIGCGSITRRKPGYRSTTAARRRKRWRKRARALTWCWPWKWSSTSPMSACSSVSPAPW